MNISRCGDFYFGKLFIIDSIYLIHIGTYSECLFLLADVSFKNLVNFIKVAKFVDIELFTAFFYVSFDDHGISTSVLSFIPDISNLCPLSNLAFPSNIYCGKQVKPLAVNLTISHTPPPMNGCY